LRARHDDRDPGRAKAAAVTAKVRGEASLEPGAVVSALAREAGLHPSQLYGWRRKEVESFRCRRQTDRRRASRVISLTSLRDLAHKSARPMLSPSPFVVEGAMCVR
jgi:hypothetical protein